MCRGAEWGGYACGMAQLFPGSRQELSIVDDAGASRRLDWSGSGESLTPARVAAIRQAASLFDTAHTKNLSLGQFLTVLALLASIFAGMALGVPSWWLLIGTMIVILPIMLITQRRQTRQLLQRNTDRLVSYLSSQGVCPACAYDLTANVDGGTGQVKCSECGAVWNRERIAPSSCNLKADLTDDRPVEVKYVRGVFASMCRPRSRLWLKDDRGREVRLLSADKQDAILLAKSAEHLERVRRTWKRIRPLGRVRRWLAVAGMAVLIAGFTLPFLISALSGRGGPGMNWVFVAWMEIFYLSATVRIARGSWFSNPKRVREIALERHLCPVCLADLVGLELAEDGCCACRVCAAAWRVPVKPDSPYDPPRAGDAATS